MSVKDYECENDKFEFDEFGPLCFPCALCKWKIKNDNEEPCARCGHNANFWKTKTEPYNVTMEEKQ